MRNIRSIAAVCAFSLAVAGCVTTEKPKEKAIGIDTSEVFRLGREALGPIAEKYIERGDRVLLVPVAPFGGNAVWRFVPTPAEIPQADFEQRIKPAVSAAFKARAGSGLGSSPEYLQLGKAFSYDSSKSAYAFKPQAEGLDEALLGRALAAAGYSGVEAFSLEAFSRVNPYFVDSLESGMLAAVLARQARGLERLPITSPAQSAASRDALASGRLVFGTNPLAAGSWKELLEAARQGPIQKMLVYSVDEVISDETGYIGFSLSFRLVDVAKGGVVLWSGTKTMASDDFPAEDLPLLGETTISLPAEAAASSKASIARALRDQGVKTPVSAALVKIDDISVFGTYPVTREDYAVENALEAFFGGIPGLSVVDKLFKRSYKEPWQLTHAVHYVNPLQGGDYAEFQNYYGARLMIGYRVLWKEVQGIRPLSEDGDISSRALGIYVKLVDMGASGRIVASEFIPMAPDGELRENVLYRCYARTSGFAELPAELADSGVLGASVNAALVNRRMEIAGTYLEPGSPAAPSLPSLMASGDQAAALRSSFDAYAAVRSVGAEPAKPAKEAPPAGEDADAPKTLDPVDELNLYMAVNLMQSWFEDGLVTALVAGDINVFEKLESLYSRALVRGSGGLGDRFLSPLYLSSWGPVVKKYYNLDKIVYFSLLDTRPPSSRYIKVPEGSALARYFPLVSFEPDSLQVSVVSVTTGDYDFKRDYSLK
ncbi:MAG: hypothetical protein KKA67_10425 [Spirochaetes bacterium]|nr:hypothetical protein [Spirochaetota bacterium]MBU1079813.1 hypothetical protein [Spirochaetota bacterium]